MAGVVNIKYDNWSTNGGVAPWGDAVPYVQFSRTPIFAGGKWGQQVDITLTGKLGLGIIPNSPGWPGAAGLDYPEGLQALEEARDNVIEAFSKSLKTFEFEDSDAPPNKMEFPNTVVESVDFPDSQYGAFLEFSIKLKAYEQDYFMAQGIVDPVDEFSTTENEDGTLNISHTISARGVDYTAGTPPVTYNGLSNAIAWVDSRKGGTNKSGEGVDTAWHGGTKTGYANPTVHLILLEQNELINRLSGTYEVSETFIGYLDEANNLQNTNYGVRYSVEINESLNQDFHIVTISGTFKGGQDTTLQDMRDAVPDEQLQVTGLYAMARELSKYDGGGNPARETLYPIATDFSLEENETEKTIKIKATFDTNPLFVEKDENGELQPSRYYFDHKVTIDVDDISKISKVSISGDLMVRGLYTERSFYIKEFLDKTDVMDFLWEKADESHEEFMKICYECTHADGDYWVRVEPGDTHADQCSAAKAGGVPVANPVADRCHELGPHAESISISTQTYGEEYGTIRMSATFTDEDFLILGSGKPYGKCSYNVSVESPIEYVKASPSAQKKYNGHWAIQKFGMKSREKSTTKVDLNLREDSGVAQDDMEGILRVRADQMTIDLNALLDQQESFDMDKSINVKEAKTDSVSETLKRSYVPDEENAICIEIEEPESGKNCYNCMDGSSQVGNSIYAVDSDAAQLECDKKGDSLTPTPCDSSTDPIVENKCWKCIDYGSVGSDPSQWIIYSEQWAPTEEEAQGKCDLEADEGKAVPCPSGVTCWACLQVFLESCPNYQALGHNTEQECIDAGDGVSIETAFASVEAEDSTAALTKCESILPPSFLYTIKAEPCT